MFCHFVHKGEQESVFPVVRHKLQFALFLSSDEPFVKNTQSSTMHLRSSWAHVLCCEQLQSLTPHPQILFSDPTQHYQTWWSSLWSHKRLHNSFHMQLYSPWPVKILWHVKGAHLPFVFPGGCIYRARLLKCGTAGRFNFLKSLWTLIFNNDIILYWELWAQNQTNKAAANSDVTSPFCPHPTSLLNWTLSPLNVPSVSPHYHPLLKW